MSLTENEFNDFVAALQNIDLTGVSTFDDLIDRVNQLKNATQEAQAALSWDDQMKLLNALSKDKSINNIKGGMDFLIGYEKDHPELIMTAAKESAGRYSQAYIEALKESLIKISKN